MSKSSESWKLDLLWRDLLGNEPESTPVVKGYDWINGCLVNSHINQRKDKDPIWHGSSFHGRAGVQFSTTGVEVLMTKAKLQLLRKYRVPKEGVVLDAGSADGRITNLLLDMGFKKIVATDLELDNSLLLVSSLDAGRRESVLGIVDDINNLPLADQTFDAIVSWGLFTATPDFERALNSTVRLLKPEGIMISAEPILEQSLIYALVRGDVCEFMRIARSSTRARMWDQKDLRYRLYTLNEIDALMRRAPIEIIERDGVSMFPSLIYGGVFQDHCTTEAEKQELLQVILQLSDRGLQAYRQIVYVSRRVPEGRA
jgi:SAM-dependent methyltransferase